MGGGEGAGGVVTWVAGWVLGMGETGMWRAGGGGSDWARATGWGELVGGCGGGDVGRVKEGLDRGERIRGKK